MTTVFHSAHKVDVDGEVDDFWMLVDGDTITQTGSGETPDADTSIDLAGTTLTPGFIELHCHGGGGNTFDDGPDEIERALHTHRMHGTTRTLISLVSNPIAMLRDSLGTVAALTERDPLILGPTSKGHT